MKKRLIRTINEPVQSYEEDPARMIRAVRAAARLDFAVEAKTREAIIDNREKVLRCPKARLLEEVLNIFKLGGSERSMRLLWQLGLTEYLVPVIHSYLLRNHHTPFDPPKEDILFELLRMLDSDSDAEPSVLFALIIFPLVLEKLEEDPKKFWFTKAPGPLIKASQSIIDALTKDVELPKRHRSRILEILVAQYRLVVKQMRGNPEKFAARPYFPQALQFFKIASKTVDLDMRSDIAYWSKFKRKTVEKKSPMRGKGKRPQKGAGKYKKHSKRQKKRAPKNVGTKKEANKNENS